jgi:hypothetical protein
LKEDELEKVEPTKLKDHQNLMYLYYKNTTLGVCSRDKPIKMMEDEILFEDPEEDRVISRFKPTF